MKTWLTVVVVLGLCIAFDVVMMKRLEEGTRRMDEKIEEIRQSIMAEQWEEGRAGVEELDRLWEETRQRIHSIMMHEELELVEENMAELNTLICTRDPDDTDDILTVLARLETVLEHLSARYSFTKENLL